MSEHLWKQCARWLCALEVLPSDHRIVQQDTKIEDLAYTLRDGVVLCHILATIDPTCLNLKDVNQRPQMARFLCLKNIRIFLSTCNTPNHTRFYHNNIFLNHNIFDMVYSMLPFYFVMKIVNVEDTFSQRWKCLLSLVTLHSKCFYWCHVILNTIKTLLHYVLSNSTRR